MLKYKEKWKNHKEIKVNKKEKQIMETKLFIEQPQLHQTNTLKHDEMEKAFELRKKIKRDDCIKKKSCIRETKHLSTDADSSTNAKKSC